MAVYESRVVTTHSHEWRLPSPVNHVEFDKAMSAAEAAFREHFTPVVNIFDDSINVRAEDDEIVIWWVSSRP